MRLVQSLDMRKRIKAIPFQKTRFTESVGLSYADCERQAWVIFPDGQKAGGAEAINWTMAVILRTRLPVWVYQLWGVRQTQNAIYRWVERNRRKFPGVEPYCSAHPDECGDS